MEFKKFTSIEKFSDAWLQMQKQDIGKMYMRTKIKLHGTNAGVRIVDGNVFYQKRTDDITPLADNAGFASWAYTVPWKTDKNIIIYGEWAGPGVQKSDAVSLIEKKHFFVFGVLDGENMVVEPELIQNYLPDHPQIRVIPWFDEKYLLDSEDVSLAKAFSQKLDQQVKEIGAEDPYIKSQFNISGAGEGLVVAPYDESGIVPAWFYNTFVFKVKSEAHLVQKTKGPNASIYVEIPGSVKDFCDQFVTDNRCEQMIKEHCGGSYALQGMGTFLKELNADILKESKNEFAALGVDWKMVAKELNQRAVKWLKEKNAV